MSNQVRHGTLKESALILDGETIAELSAVKPLQWLWAALCDWILILGAAACFLMWPYWYVCLAAIAVIGNRQHALGVLMHDAVHYRVAGKRACNDLLSDLIAGYLLFLPTSCYRAFHLPHHRYLDTPDDPEREFVRLFPGDLSFPQHPLRLLWTVVRDLSGLWPVGPLALAKVIWSPPGRQRLHAIPVLLLHAAILTTAYFTGLLHVYFLLWITPLLTVFAATFRIRGIAEHLGIEEAGPQRYSRAQPEPLLTTRTMRGVVGGIVIAPHAVGYHLEHHLYPSVPFHNLPKLSGALLKKAPEQFAPRIRSSYSEAIAECLTTRRQ